VRARHLTQVANSSRVKIQRSKEPERE